MTKERENRPWAGWQFLIKKEKVQKSRIDMLKQLIGWREITDEDIKNVDMDATAGLNEEEIFPRNAIRQLFDHYYEIKNKSEIRHFSDFIIEKCQKSDYYYFAYGKQFRKIISFLIESGELLKAKQLCERSLLDLNVLENKRGNLTISSFLEGNYSFSYPVIFLEIYLKILVQMGEMDRANRLLSECLNNLELMDDSNIMFHELKQKLAKKHEKPRYPIIKIKKESLEACHLKNWNIELVALSYLKDKLKMDGVFSSTEVWELLKGIISDRLTNEDFKQIYKQIRMFEPPDDFYDFVLHNANVFQLIFRAKNITFGMGYPDLVMYKKSNFSDFMLVEVKDVNDKLSFPQKARINHFLEHNVPFGLLQFVK